MKISNSLKEKAAGLVIGAVVCGIIYFAAKFGWKRDKAKAEKMMAEQKEKIETMKKKNSEK